MKLPTIIRPKETAPALTDETLVRELAAALMSSPVNADRPATRNLVPHNPDRLAKGANKALTLGKDYQARDTYQRELNAPEAPYAVRLHRLTGHLVTKQRRRPVKSQINLFGQGSLL